MNWHSCTDPYKRHRMLQEWMTLAYKGCFSKGVLVVSFIFVNDCKLLTLLVFLKLYSTFLFFFLPWNAKQVLSRKYPGSEPCRPDNYRQHNRTCVQAVQSAYLCSHLYIMGLLHHSYLKCPIISWEGITLTHKVRLDVYSTGRAKPSKAEGSMSIRSV